MLEQNVNRSEKIVNFGPVIYKIRRYIESKLDTKVDVYYDKNI